MKKVVITGASSFIGRHLINYAKDLWDITAVVRRQSNTEGLPEKVKILRLDMAEYDRLGQETGSCDCLVHLAWQGVRGADRMDAKMQNDNLNCSLKGIDSVLEKGCGRIVLAGSQAEYGPHSEKITEETECCPNTEYGKAKLKLHSELTKKCKFGAAYKLARFFSLYGPGDFANTMIMATLPKMLSGEVCPFTSGLQMWDYLYIDDAVKALYRLCAEDCTDGVYNFGSGDVRTLREYIEEMARITQSRSELCFGAIPYAETGMVSLWPDVEKLKREIHWEPEVSFEQGILSILKHWGK